MFNFDLDFFLLILGKKELNVYNGREKKCDLV